MRGRLLHAWHKPGPGPRSRSPVPVPVPKLSLLCFQGFALAGIAIAALYAILLAGITFAAFGAALIPVPALVNSYSHILL